MRFMKSRWAAVVGVLVAFTVLVPAAVADPDDSLADQLQGPPGDLGSSLAMHDAATADVVSSGPFAQTIKNIDRRGEGVRSVVVM